MKHLAFITSSLLCLLSTTAFAYVTSQRLAPAYHTGTYDLHYSGEYFMSDENLSSEFGDVDALNGDGSYSEFLSRLEGGYTFPQFPVRAFGYATATYASTESELRFSPGFYDSNTATAFNNLAVGAQYFFKTKQLLFIPEFIYEHSFDEYESYNASKADYDPILSDSTSAIQVGTFIASYLWKLKSEAYVGYRYHMEDMADMLLLSWRLALRYSSWTIAGRLSGAIPVTDDVVKGNYTDEVYRRETLRYSNGGSFRHRAINPQWYEAGVEGTYKFDDKMAALIGAKHTITGQNAAHGLTILFGFTAEFGDSGSQNILDDPAGAEFQPELEEYDRSIFE